MDHTRAFALQPRSFLPLFLLSLSLSLSLFSWSALLASSCRQVSVIRVAVEKKAYRRHPNVPAEFPISSVWRTGKKGLNDEGPWAQGPSNEIEGALAAPFLATTVYRGDNRYGLPIHLRVAPCTCSRRPARHHLIARTLLAAQHIKVTAWPIACRRHLPRSVVRVDLRSLFIDEDIVLPCVCDQPRLIRFVFKRTILRWSVPWRQSFFFLSYPIIKRRKRETLHARKTCVLQEKWFIKV